MRIERKLSDYINSAKSLQPNQFGKKIRLAILSSFTLNGLEETLRVKCSEIKVDCNTYVAAYNQYSQEILNPKSNLYKFSSDICFLILDGRTLLGNFHYFPYSSTLLERKKFIENKYIELTDLIKKFTNESKSKLVLTSFTIPTFSPYGIYETKVEYGLQDMVNDLNSRLNEFIKDQESVYFYDFNGFVTRYGENNVFNYRQFFFGDIKISIDYIPYLAHSLISYVKAVLGLSKKCVVVDLDNTLWGGVVGEDGFEGIRVGPTVDGKPFLEFQKILLSLHQRGIILAINSKNNLEDAMQVIREHPDMILREEHFASLKINWNDKVTNMKEIASELNIGLDSVIYFDDDPVNREFVRLNLPEVLTIDLPNDSSQYALMLMEMNDFDQLNITEDDTKRGNMYLQQKKRMDLQSSTTNLEDFLKQLDISIKIKKADKFTVPRISQLTLKTNQFNLTTHRYQEEDIKKMLEDKMTFVGCAQVEDKFGDNGITGVFIVNKENKESWSIDTFLLSCRVMGRGVEDGIMSHILQRARDEGAKRVTGQHIPTKKNKPCENFLSDFGFKREGDLWVYSLGNPIKMPEHVKVIIE